MTPLDYTIITGVLLWSATAIWWIIAAIQLVKDIQKERNP